MTKKHFSFFIFLLSFISINAQSVDIIDNYKKQLLSEVNYQFVGSDFDDVTISNQYTDNKTKITHIYLQQNYKGIPIYNAVGSVHLKNDKIASKTTSFVSGVKSIIESNQLNLEPVRAIHSVANHLGIVAPEINANYYRDNKDQYIFDAVSFTNAPVKVKPCYVLNKNKKLRIAWNVEADMKNNDDYWSIRVDATDGSVIDQNNYTVYCAYDKPDKISLTSIRSVHNSTISNSRADLATYKVYALPAESPIHGDHVVVSDPNIIEASPLGWHDDDGSEGAEYTITQGNNVHAYLDKNDDNIADGGEPDGGDSLYFVFEHQANSAPNVNDAAAQVNLFYMNNMMHDISYVLGFDEQAGNFQNNTYNNNGAGNDAVEAQASDGADLNDPDHANNANFSTPPDGTSGRMQMFLWDNSGGLFTIDSPQQIAGLISEVGTANFGPTVDSDSITGKVAIVDDGSSSGTIGCQSLVNPEEIQGNIALIDRAQCDFFIKTKNAQDAGAIAVIICNIAGVNGGNGDEIITMGEGDNTGAILIPSLFMKKSICDQIKASILSNVDVIVTFEEKELQGPNKFDASFDNGVVGHEYGHGISNRLVGGPSNTGCLSNDEQMGEGWSDFWTIAFTVQEGDNGAMGKGIGNYVDGKNTNGRGIRQFPYSTDMNINPMTYDDIKGTTGPHALGAVWNSMLYDLYWAFIDLYGYNGDWTDETSGNHIGAKLVLEGMKQTKCSPGFIDGRNGILIADELLSESAHTCLIWEVFARRGLGFYATQGADAEDRNDGVESFNPLPTCTQTLKIENETTSIIDADDFIDVNLHLINHVPSTQTNVVVTERLPEGLNYVDGSASLDGNPISATVMDNDILFSIDEMGFEQELDIEFQLYTDSDFESLSIVFAGAEDDDADDWEPIILEGSSFFEQDELNVHSGDYAWHISDEELEMDAALQYRLEVEGDNPTLRFWHQYNTEAAFDGGYVRVSTNNGLTWDQVEDKFIRNGYNSTIAYTTFALPSLRGFSGNSNGFIDSYIDLNDYKGQSIIIQFRFATDAEAGATGANTGWSIDDFELLDLVSFETVSCVHSDENLDDICTSALLTILNSGDVTSVDNTIESINSFEMAPNPASKETNLSINATKSSLTDLYVYDLLGKLILEKAINITKGLNSITIPLDHLANGQYMIVLRNTEGQINQKLLIID